MHTPLRKEIMVDRAAKSRGGAGGVSGGAVATVRVKVCCLSKVGYMHAAAFFEYDWDTGLITELDPPTGLPDFAGPGDDVDSGSDE
mmetsp:Transcript_21513/g.73711  ORF Transcript_21513/g.73711 Transcript_21513/m.73711 type:complete len:86 (+) Transcript_21513:1443-1700(+)